MPTLIAVSTPPIAGPQPTADSEQSARPKGRRWGRWFLGALFAVVAWQLLMPAGVDPCDSALAASRSADQVGQLDTAKNKAFEAVGACRGDKQSEARGLFEALEKRIVSAQGCQAAVKEYQLLIEEGRIQQAVSLANLKLRTCESPNAKQARERELTELRKAVEAKQEAIRTRLDTGDIDGARATVEELRKLDRDHPNLPALATAVERADREAGSKRDSESPSTQPQNALVGSPPQVQPTPAPPQAPVVNPVQDMAAAMLREGEAALTQRRYAEARALAVSILRVLPDSAHARDLMNRANDAENRALREETTLK